MFDDQVTVLVPTSPIPRHPDTSLIEECLSSVRLYFPDARIVVMADGVRPQVEHRRGQYGEYKAALAERLKLYGRCELMAFGEVSQQCTMTRKALETVDTPNILFVEHDAMLRAEPTVNFAAIFGLLDSGEANLVRFYNWDDIWWEHRPMMRGEIDFDGARFVKTVQYSGWPFVSRADYHRRLFDRYHAPHSLKMIETVMYYPVAGAPWEENKIVIYIDGARGFTHRDGRADEKTGIRDGSEW